jgi:hypothetical protein
MILFVNHNSWHYDIELATLCCYRSSVSSVRLIVTGHQLTLDRGLKANNDKSARQALDPNLVTHSPCFCGSVCEQWSQIFMQQTTARTT